MMIYNKDNKADIPSLDLLTFLFGELLLAVTIKV